MGSRFDVELNGEKVFVAGLNGAGLLDVRVEHVLAPETPEDRCELQVWGSELKADGSWQQRDWGCVTLQEGDELYCRILPEGDFDEPFEAEETELRTLSDPVLGTLQEKLPNLWLGSLPVPSGPFAGMTARIEVWGDEPDDRHRQLWCDFSQGIVVAWPETCEALVKLGVEIDADQKPRSAFRDAFVMRLAGDGRSVTLVLDPFSMPECTSCELKFRDGKLVGVMDVENPWCGEESDDASL